MLTDPAVIAALGRAAARGLEVRVLLEESPYNPGNPNAALSGNQAIASQLDGLGVTVLWSNPQFNFTHAKTMIVDGAVAYVLTYNLTRAATEDNREFGMINRSPSDVEELKRIFLADWNRVAYRPIDPDLVVSPDNARWRILGLMEQAQNELWVGVEVISDPEAMALLIAKKKAGVDVRVLDGAVKKVTANYAPMKYLVENGVPTRSQARPYLHAKYAIADGQAAYVGSINLSTNSLDENRELGMLVDSPEACQSLRQVWQNDWARSESFETVQLKMAK
jgi:phosphatidylserine/phosphatidylglycerophosphate/cardiolipin synthase-like enzyme